jgi:asparagine synthase (glutamine-hydrolysing)
MITLKRKSWKKYQNSFVVGYAFIENKLLTESEISEECINAIQQNNLSDFLKSLNGSFAAIIYNKGIVYLIVDRLRSYPLLYSKRDNDYCISDSADGLVDAVQSQQIHNDSVAELLALGYMSNNKTLFECTYTVEAGNFVTIQDTVCTVHVYYNHIHLKHMDNDDKIVDRSEIIIKNAFARVFKTIGNRQVVIPLSGGYDSRLVACMCKEFGLKNVVCFTYGCKDSWEVEMSHHVAEKLEFKWFFVEYTAEIWEKTVSSKLFLEFEKFAGNFNAVPHIQDLPAIQFLVENKIIEPDAVVIPGHSGDLLGGSHLPEFSIKLPLYSLIYRNYYRLNSLRNHYRKRMLTGLYQTVGGMPIWEDIEGNMNTFNNWGIKYRQGNFIVNSVRVYEFFCLEWRIPLWDNEFAEYWNSISWEKKQGSKLFQQFLFEKYFIRLNVDLQQPVIHKKMQKVFNQVRQVLPDNMVPMLRGFKNFIFRNHEKKIDVNYMNVIINYLKNTNKKVAQKYISQQPRTANGILAIDYFRICKSYYKKK